tara:strand:- start:1538 stop:2413 length:876 start_codon:yes stop_codon:yes gene_type:complete
MIRTSRAPGNFSHTSLGKSTHATLGWQRFRLLDSDVITEQNDPVILSSIVENANSTVVTYNKTHNTTHASTSPIAAGDIFAKPLRDAEGRLVSFADPFTLRIRLELISMTGDYRATTGTDKAKPQILIGVCANASDFDATTNKHMAFGWRNKAESSSSQAIDHTPVLLKLAHTQNDGDGHLITNLAGSYDTGTNLYEGQIIVGPDTDISDNAAILCQGYHDSGDDFSKANVAYQLTRLDDVDNNCGAGQVYLFIAIADTNALNNGSSTDCVMTIRFSYMLDADPVNGWGTS